MAKRSILLLAVVAFLGCSVAASAISEGYITYIGQLLSTQQSTSSGYGYVPTLNPTAYSNFQSNVYYSPDDGTQTLLHVIQNPLEAPVRPDAFSYNNDIPAWLALPVKTFSYSIAQNDSQAHGLNDDIIQINNYGVELNVVHSQLVYPGTSLGNTDIIDGKGRLQRGDEFVLADFDYTLTVPDVSQRIYFSEGAGQANVDIGGNSVAARPQTTWVSGGSDYQGKASAADILTASYDSDGLLVGASYFEKAWKIAGTMLGDTFWTSGLVWNNTNGYVATSTAANAAQVAGHSVLNNFMRFVFDIDALTIYDMDTDGVFDVADGDAVLFSVTDTHYYDKFYDWTNTWQTTISTDTFAGQYFDGDTVFLYTGGTVVTYMDKGTGIFFGNAISTTDATIWGEESGAIDITGFDIDLPIPEPSTIILVVGAGLTLGAGILRRRIR